MIRDVIFGAWAHFFTKWSMAFSWFLLLNINKFPNSLKRFRIFNAKFSWIQTSINSGSCFSTKCLHIIGWNDPIVKKFVKDSLFSNKQYRNLRFRIWRFMSLLWWRDRLKTLKISHQLSNSLFKKVNLHYKWSENSWKLI